MSEFNFSCPACGQTVSGNATPAGREMTCPSCQAHFFTPADASGTPRSVSAPPDSPPVFTGYTGTTEKKTSGLAIASLVCSLSSIVTCVGWVPGIICGHLAKSRIRRNSALKGRGLASAGLLIGYLTLLAEAGTVAIYAWRISTAVKQGIVEVQNNLATNNIVITQSTTATNNEPVESAAEAGEAEWNADLSHVPFPDHPISGKLRGMDFTLKSAIFRNGDLRLTGQNGMVLDILRLGASVEGQNYQVQTADNNAVNPRVRMTWQEGDAEMTATFSKGYAMKLQFDQANKRRVAGKIYLCLPDEAKSCVAGTLDVRIPQSRNGAGN